MTVGDKVFNKGDYITIDGSKGYVYEDTIKVKDPIMTDDFDKIMSWARTYKTM